ncbi:MAG: heat-inducible transcriptional repressor HrcA [Alphaproteobacteria bacterium]|nr:heat-inducible transcriptional repressor HrcA [Alphaproteobacteria bacterium]
MPLAKSPSIVDLNDRSREIFRVIVDTYVTTGDPIGSRTIARRLDQNLSPATIRNVMADLQDLGLLSAPHISAGRVPTEIGLRLFVNGLLEIGSLTEDERREIESRCATAGRSIEEAMEQVSEMLSGLSHHAGMVVAPHSEKALTHIEFVHLGGGRALVILVDESGIVENRVIDLPPGLPPGALVQASNYLQARLVGRHLTEARREIEAELEAHRTLLDQLTQKVVEAGLAVRAGEGRSGTLIIRGQARLLDDVTAVSDLERIRELFDALEAKESLIRLVDAAERGQGTQIFIGAESELFRHSGWSMIIAPYKNTREQIIGAIGVIGPTRLNYARIIPMVDYTAKAIGRMLG